MKVTHMSFPLSYVALELPNVIYFFMAFFPGMVPCSSVGIRSSECHNFRTLMRFLLELLEIISDSSCYAEVSHFCGTYWIGPQRWKLGLSEMPQAFASITTSKSVTFTWLSSISWIKLWQNLRQWVRPLLGNECYPECHPYFEWFMSFCTALSFCDSWVRCMGPLLCFLCFSIRWNL